MLKGGKREDLKFNVSVRSLKTGDNLEVDLINFCLQLVSPDSIFLFMAMSPLPPQYVLHSNAYLHLKLLHIFHSNSYLVSTYMYVR